MKRTTTRSLAALLCVITWGAQAQQAEVFIPGYGFNGVHGLTFDKGGHLYVGSVVGQQIHQIDPATGESTIWQGAPTGMADDLEFGPDGTLAWTSFIIGTVHARKGDGPVRELATGLPGINSLAWTDDGRLFATQVFLGDALYEIDPEGEKPARKIMENMGGLNGFDFGPDGKLYGPLWFKGQVARVDVDAGTLEVVAEGFGVPAAANFNSLGELYVLDTQRGDVVRVNPNNGDTETVAHVRTALDNLAFDNMDRLYVTVMAENAVFRVDTRSGKVTSIKEAALALPLDMEVYGDTLYLSDNFSLKAVSLITGDIRSISRFPEHDLHYPNGIDVTDKHIHTASWFNSVVQTIDRETGEALKTIHEVPTAYDVLEDADGSLLVVQFLTNSLVRLKGEHGEDRETVARRLTTPVGLASAGAGKVYVTLHNPGKVVRVDLASGEFETVAEGLDKPEGLAVAADGSIVVAEVGAKRVTRIDPKTGAKKTLATNVPMGLGFPPGIPPQGMTSGVAISADGSVYVSSDIEDAIYRIPAK